MFKRWYETWQKRRLCDHHWHDVGSYYSRESDNLYIKQYCPLCDKKRNKSKSSLEQEKEIEKVKRMYKD